MRYLQVALPTQDWPLHWAYTRLLDAADADRGWVVAFAIYRDRSVMGVCALDLEPAVAHDVLDDVEYVREYDVFGDPETCALYLHGDPGDTLQSLLVLLDDHRLVIDTPMEVTETATTVRVVGPAARLSAAAEALPPDVTAEMQVLEAGEFAPRGNQSRSSLTDRQREVLEAAVETGYYADPRQATVEEVAAAADCAESTASEHLRKIEARVLSRLA